MLYQETSREVWNDFLFNGSGSVDLAILTALEYAGGDGLTDWELEQITGVQHQTVSGNRRHLVESGLVTDSGRTRVCGPNKRNRIVWVLPEFNPEQP